MNNTFNLEAKRYTSNVLASWAKSRPGFAERVSNSQVVTSMSSDSSAIRELFAPITAASGFAVNDRTAMLVSTVYACLTKTSGAVLQLPIHHYRKSADGERERISNSPYWWLLNESPHPAWTSAAWKDWIVRCVALRGDQFTRIMRSSNGTGGSVVGLDPLHPEQVIVRRVGTRNVYDVMNRITGSMDTVDQDDMLHFTGFGYNGLTSLSAIQWAARQAIGNSLAAAEYSGRTIGEGAMPQIALSFPNKMGKEQAADLRAAFVATYGGVGSRKVPLVLTEGAKVDELSISPVDMQLIESRRFEKEDICQALEVPPVLIGENDKASAWGTGIEQIIIGFVKFAIKPKLVRWEEELNRKLFRRAGQFVEFELDGLLSGDSKAQSEVFKSALGGPGAGNGYMTVNEVRRLKNLPRKDGGDELYLAQSGTPTNSQNAGSTP